MDENVQIVRRLLVALNLRDVREALELMDPAVGLFAPQTTPGIRHKGLYRGVAGIREFFDDMGEVGTSLR